jgi:acyl-CoA thioesterase-1
LSDKNQLGFYENTVMTNTTEKMTKKGIVTAVLVILCVLLSSCDGPRQEKTDKSPDKAAVLQEYEGTIVALGDSLTAGLGVELEESYPAVLQRKLNENGYSFRVTNAGVSGETTSGTVSRLNWILSQRPDIVILEIGANDGLRGIDTTLVEKNIRTILERLQEEKVVTVLAGMKMVWNLGDGYTGRFNAIYPELAAEFGVLFMPFFLDDVAAVPSLNSSDGIHPNSDGYKVITENIYPYVLQAINEKRAATAEKE